MAFETNRRFALKTRAMEGAKAEAPAVDQGLRTYMLKVYNYMVSGLLLTGVVAMFSSSTPAILNLLYVSTPDGKFGPTMLAYVVMFAPLAFVLAINFGVNKMRASTLQMVFWAFAAVMGLSLTHIFLTFTGASITRVFFITAGAFAGLSLYGYTTKKDLTGLGSFMIMGLWGLLIAMVVNIFLASSAMMFVISVIGVLIFAGLTAYDTQKIKLMYSQAHDGETSTKLAIMGAVSLYLDFINMFVFLLHLLGNRE